MQHIICLIPTKHYIIKWLINYDCIKYDLTILDAANWCINIEHYYHTILAINWTILIQNISSFYYLVTF